MSSWIEVDGVDHQPAEQKECTEMVSVASSVLKGRVGADPKLSSEVVVLPFNCTPAFSKLTTASALEEAAASLVYLERAPLRSNLQDHILQFPHGCSISPATVGYHANC
jgi:hypothetical protein